MQDYKVEERFDKHRVRIVIIGVGGGGCNMLQELIGTDIEKQVELVAINTDAVALKASSAPHKFLIGEKTTKGLGSGMKPEVGKASAIENYDDIKAFLSAKR
jgi:cell division protein FtsZ